MAKQQHPKDTKNSSRISDVDCKKAAKQEKFLSVVQHSDVNVALLNAADIRNEVIVFDGTSSHPPPPIYPPPRGEYYYYYFMAYELTFNIVIMYHFRS